MCQATRLAPGPVGQTDAVSGTLDGVDYSLFCMKEPDYVIVMKLMATGVLQSDDMCP
jgi:hypothetical protein